MLVSTQEIITAARKNHYAIGCFLVYNLETALGIARAAKAKQAPIIMAVSESTISYAGLKPITHIVETIAKNEAVNVPIALHLDHGKTFKSVVACIESGFSSVQIDASNMALDENIRLTKEVVAYGHKQGVWVEGELGEMRGGHGESGEFKGEIPLVNPDEVKQFVEQTEVDLLAAAIGTVHGDYSNERVHFDLLEEILKITKTPVVLHGASGLPDEDIINAVKSGICKVNFGTEIKKLFIDSVRGTLVTEKNITGVRELMGPTIEAITDLVSAKIDLLGSARKASIQK
ncbi:MAG: class II fructose-bisphosphate aldolase [Patescibacteria group bacterium]|jgi:ketose-bisphosphate aldolase